MTVMTHNSVAHSVTVFQGHCQPEIQEVHAHIHTLSLRLLCFYSKSLLVTYVKDLYK